MSATTSPAAPPSGWLRFINDPRDEPFLKLMTQASLVIIPFAILLFVPGVFRWWLGAIYLVINGAVFLDRFILMLHNTSHRPFFKSEYRWMNHFIPWVLGPFFGETPETYFAHHVGMHHPENNLPDDLSTTMPYQRDSIAGFAKYFFSFLGRGLFDLATYMAKNNRRKLLANMLVGEIGFWLVTVGLMFVNWRATLVVFAGPVIIVRFLMMAGNWGQHAFIDASRPANAYTNSINVLHNRYNRRCFNDGYHIGHHLVATRHWTEMPSDFEANKATYGKEGAIVLRDVDFVGVWFLLMLHRYDSLAKHYVQLGEKPLSHDEIVTLLRQRTAAIPASESAQTSAIAVA
jgi:fatty acid desaturase